MGKPPGIPNELFAYERKKRHWTQWDVADKISAPDERLIRRWERGEVAPTPHYRGKLAEVFGKSARALGFPPDGQISFWHVPYRRNAFFTGRDDILQLLRDTFLAQHASSVPRLPLALSGLPGVGKSQIALEYAYRYREHYHTVLWLHAASDQDLIAGVTAAANLLDLPGKDAANPAQLIETLKEWLTQLTRWLLIFDNVEHLQLLTGFLPDEPAEIKGHLLLTTRSQSTGTHAHRIAVEPLGSDTGAELLLRRAKLIPIENTLEHIAAADAATACSLSEDMGGLPLALDQAGAYIEETAVLLSEYVQRFQDERRDLLNRRGSWAGDSEHPLPVAATLKLSFEQACEVHPLASDILRFCSFLKPDAISEELLQHDYSFKFGTTDFDEAIAALLRYSLIKRNTQEKTFSMHRLVQTVLIDDMSTDLLVHWSKRVELAMVATSPVVFLVRFLRLPIIAEYSEPLYQRTLAFREQHLGAEHPATIMSLRNLAVLYLAQSKYKQAEPLLVQALSLQESQLGAEHLDTAWSLYLLARLYHEQHQYEQAELLYQRALRIFERHHVAEYPDTTYLRYDLTLLLHDQGKHEQAEAVHQRALSSLEQQFGAKHPTTQAMEVGYADFLRSIGRDAEAAALEIKNGPSA